MAITTKVKATDYAVLNPASGELLEQFCFHTDADIQLCLNDAATCFPLWKDAGFEYRSECFIRLAELLRREQDALARTMALEMGKPLAQGKAEAEKSAFVCEHYAEHAESFLSPYEVSTDMSESRVVYEPLGSIFAVMPWNFPLWQVFRAAAPIMMSGNTMLLKHAPRVPRTALSIEKCVFSPGFPKEP